MKPKLYNFDLLSYPHMPLDAPGTPVPSTYFDPLLGAQNYREHLTEMEYCEELNFDGVVFNEHHYSAYGTMPSPNLIAASLSRTTKRVKIGVLGNILPLRNHPVRVAEEYAMIDCLSNGRLIAGFVRGIPAEYLWYNVRPEESRGRFQEAYELILKAWTEPVWSYHGQYFSLENCALWPRPLQQPHPLIWIAARSAESVEWCAQREIPIAQVYQTTGQIEDTFNYYRDVSQKNGRDAGPEKFILCRHIYVGPAENEVRPLLEPAMTYFFKLHNRGFNQGKTMPAPLQQVKDALYSEHSFDYFRPGNRERIDFSKLTWEELDETGYLLAGTPDSVARKLNRQLKQVGAGHFMGIFHIGHMPHDKVMESLRLFSEKVAPQLGI